MKRFMCPFVLGAVFLSLAVLGGCGPTAPPPPESLIAPTPILSNSGEFMSPYTQDEVLAEWVDMAIKARLGSSVGQMAGAFAGQQLCRQIPFVGGFVGSAVGKEIGRNVAIKAAGGMEHIRATSDVSFSDLDAMAVYLYVTHGTNEHYQQALSATMEIYPDLKSRYMAALHKAPRKPGQEVTTR